MLFKSVLVANALNCRRLTRLLQPKRSYLQDETLVKSKFLGVSGARYLDQNEEICLYPVFDRLNVVTSERTHKFSVPPNQVVQLIKLGAINKQISIQYCHYLAFLFRHNHDPEEKEFYAKICGELLSYILRTYKDDIPPQTRATLLLDVARTNRENTSTCFSQLTETNELPLMGKVQFKNFFRSLLVYGLWQEARQLLQMATPKMLSFLISNSLVEGLELAAIEYQALESETRREQLRTNVIETIYLFCELAAQHRIQFIAKQRNVLLRVLTNLRISVCVNSQIKMTGRCTNCNQILPLFDHSKTKELNEAIRKQMLKGADKGLFLNSSPNDVYRFEKFLEEIHAKDGRPIDCVIDGLNIAYQNSLGYSHYKQKLTDTVAKTYKVPKLDSQANILMNIIIRGGLLRRFRKIVVVGKMHMLKWPGLVEFFEKNNIHFYTSYNNSKDDLFQLYASTLSQKTILITNDFLRDHLAQMDDSSRMLMERWIDTHQTWICKRTLVPLFPTPFEKIPSVDRNSNQFHLPVIDFHQLHLVGVSDPPPHLSDKSLIWFCCNTQQTDEEEEKEEEKEKEKSSQTVEPSAHIYI